ncbi:MAG: heparinase II/III family protein [Lentisphaeria bacterium]|nr:heparinase II/III family protein [Lentisphaeria bacterium]
MKKEYRKVTEFKTSAEFAEYVKSEGFHIGFASDGKHDALAQSIECMGMTIGNRWAILPMEGWDCLSDGNPSALTHRRWLRFAASGAKLIYGTEAGAVMESGRSNPRQLMINENTFEALKGLVDAMHIVHREKFGRDDDLCIGIQLTHSGRYSHPHEDAVLESVTAYSHPLLDKKFGNSEANVASDEEVENIIKHFISAAKIAKEAGFDFVDIKHAHGYLAHEFLTAYDRPGKYGGSFVNRTRFCREIIEGIKREVPGLKISVRLSIFDIMPFVKGEDGIGKPMEWDKNKPYPYAFGGDGSGLNMDPDLKETSQFIDLLKSYGVDLICGTIGSPYYSVHMQRPAYYPVTDGYIMPENPLYNVGRHLQAVKRIKELHPDVKFVASGLTCLQEYLPNAAEYAIENNWADFAGIGRMVLSYPEMCADVQSGRPLQRKKICRTFGDCTNAPRNGMISGCYPLDEYYRQKPAAMRVAGLKKIFNSTVSKRRTDKFFDSAIPADLYENISKGQYNKQFYPVFADRKAWENVRQNKYADKLIELADQISDEDVPVLLFSKYREFIKIGDRNGFEALYFKRRHNLGYLALALCLTGDKEKYLPRLLDNLVAITEEWTWCLPAHTRWNMQQVLKYRPSDLFCNETGMILACVHHLLADELDKEFEGISEKIRQMVLERTVYNVMYKKNSEVINNWMMTETPNNWTPWCASNCMICSFLLEKDPAKVAEAAEFFLGLGARFAERYADDGFCDEGPSYYNRAALALYELLASVAKAVPHSMDGIYSMVRVRNMFEFIAHIRLGRNHQLCFADGTPKFGPSLNSVNPCAFAIGSDILKSVCRNRTASLKFTGDAIRPGLALLFDWQEVDNCGDFKDAPLSYYKDRIAICRSEIFSVGMKVGNNNESHNHNDLGNFTLYFDGEPLIVDAGTGTYSRINFSNQRYTLWYTRGSGHNAPVLGGFEQMNGSEYTAKFINVNENELSCDLGKAYPAEAGVQKFIRTLKFKADEVIVEDDFELAKPLDAVITLLSPCAVEKLSGNEIKIGNVKVQLENIEYTGCEETPELEHGGLSLWGCPLNAIRFKSKNNNYKFIFKKD